MPRILLSTFVGRFTEYKKPRGLSNKIHDVFGLLNRNTVGHSQLPPNMPHT
jgi:hypothetical protein